MSRQASRIPADITSDIYILAPLEGISDSVFRTILAEHFPGLDSALAPFIGIPRAGSRYGALIRDLAPDLNRRLPVTPQLLGSDAEGFAALALALGRQGYPVVNWNIGCPYRTVTSKLRGAGLLPHPHKVDRFLHTVCNGLEQAGGPRVSVKARLGLQDQRELASLVPVLNRYPLEELIVHPRTGRQYYGGGVDLAVFEEVSAACRCRVTYNGDIRRVPDVVALKARLGGNSRWMIGRGVLANPFLVESLRRGADVTVDLARFRRFHDALTEGYAASKRSGSAVAGRMKEFWAHAAPTLGTPRNALSAVMASRDLDTYHAAAEACFEQASPGR